MNLRHSSPLTWRIASRVILTGLLTLIIGVLLVACGGSSTPPTPVPAAPAAVGGPVTRIATAVSSGGGPGADKANASNVHPSKGVCPGDHPIKGRREKGQRLYFVAGSAGYEQTKPETCFATETDAQAAGYHAAA